MSEGAVTTPQVIGWILTGVGIVASLSWNFFNRLHTNRTAKDLRIEQYRSSQWSRIRTRIEQALDTLIDASKAILHQAVQLDDANLNNRPLELFNRHMVDAQDGLASALEEAALSPYCEGENWRAGANGPATGTETAWDEVLACLENTLSATDRAAKIASLERIRVPISQIRSMVMDLCRVQDLTIDPDKI